MNAGLWDEIAARSPVLSETPVVKPLLRCRELTRHFGSHTAVDRVDLDIAYGEVHVLFGENGAGKSTLINMICGVLSPSAGHIEFAGARRGHGDCLSVRASGISSVFQEFSLVPDLTVAQNLFLGREATRCGLVDHRAAEHRAADLIAELGFDVDVRARVRDLSRAHQQMVEIAKALTGEVRLLILDEPTASLTEKEADRLFEVVAELKAKGVGVIYVSHRMREIKAIADRITVLRDGRKIATVNADEVSDGQLIELMTGRAVDVLYPAIGHAAGEVVLRVENLVLENGSVNGATLEVRAGEVTALAGLVGCGKSEIGRAVFGLEDIESGRIVLRGQEMGDPRPSELLDAGVVYFPSDRGAEGLALGRPILENTSMASLHQPDFSRLRVLRKGRERAIVEDIAGELQLRPCNVRQAVGALSGGNRQKVMLGRGLTRDFDVFIFDEPTVGIDVGAKVEVYDMIRKLTEAGAAVLLISSELPEVIGLASRVFVIHRGQVAAELTGAQVTEEAILRGFFIESGASEAGMAPGAIMPGGVQ